MSTSQESSEANRSATNAMLQDLDGTLNECSQRLVDHLEVIATPNSEDQKCYDSINEVFNYINGFSLKKDENPDAMSGLEHKISEPNYFKYSSSPTANSQELLSPKDNSGDETNASFLSDFSHVSTIHSMHEMTAWDKWFVMKQDKIRRKTKMESEREMNKQRLMPFQEFKMQKKKEENKARRKLWLSRKKNEMEKEKQEGEKRETEMRLKGSAEQAFKNWNLGKYHEKKIDFIYNGHIKKTEEEAKKKQSKEREETLKRWMSKAKQKPNTPQISYGYCGGSAISFYDSTRPSSPTYINPIPWKDPCLSTSSH